MFLLAETETVLINWHTFFFLLFALIACVFALGVLFASNIVRMALYLVVSLGATSGLFFLAGAEFVGAMQLMIYVGGTLVLLVFGVMLTAQKSFISMKTSGGDWVVACGLGGILLSCLMVAAFGVEKWRAPADAADVTRADVEDTARIGLDLLGVNLLGQPGYLLAFEIVSVHLLVVLIGAGYMARTKRRAGSNGTAARQREST